MKTLIRDIMTEAYAIKHHSTETEARERADDIYKSAQEALEKINDLENYIDEINLSLKLKITSL